MDRLHVWPFGGCQVVFGFGYEAWVPPAQRGEGGQEENTLFPTTKGYGSLCKAPTTLERLMERALKRLQWMTALIYLDDVIAFGEAFKNELLERP